MTSVSAVSSSTQTDQTDFAKKMSQGKKDFTALDDALKSGDLDAAKSAFETMKKNRPSGPPPGAPQDGSSGAGSQGKGGQNSDFAALEKALNSNDLTGAQTAMESIQSHRKHGHHGGSSQTATPTQSVSTDTVGSQVDLVA